MGIVFPATTKEINVEWLNEVLHKNGFLGNTDIISVDHKPMGTGRGFLSEMAKLHLTYNSNTSSLPGTMIAKWPPLNEFALRAVMSMGLFEREIRFYTDIAPNCDIRTPRIYFTFIGDNNQYGILMEDCSSFIEPDPDMNGLSLEDSKTAVLKMADFHARWWNAENRPELNWVPGVKTIFTNDPNTADSAWNICIGRQVFVDALPKGGMEAGQKIVDNFDWILNNLAQDKLSLVHDDLKSENMFIDSATPEDPLIIFDWSTLNINRGVTDLSFLLGEAVSPDTRRKIERDIIPLYHERLVENGVSDYSFNECYEDYLKGLLVLTFVPLAVSTRTDLTDPRSVEKNHNTVNQRFTAI